MNEWVGRWPDSLVSAEAGLDREFEERLRDSSGLAFSIAYGVLRNRADAEEVAQDAFARAFRRFGQLRDRDRFRSWLTRMTWRLAIRSERHEGLRSFLQSLVQTLRRAVFGLHRRVARRERATTAASGAQELIPTLHGRGL